MRVEVLSGGVPLKRVVVGVLMVICIGWVRRWWRTALLP